MTDDMPIEIKSYYYSVDSKSRWVEVEKDKKAYDPIAIRERVINDIISGKSVEEEFKQMSASVWKSEITFNDFQHWYYRIANGEVDLKYDKSLSGIPHPCLCHNQIAIRACILNDVIHEKPIDEASKEMCAVVANNTITFYDYQYWYYRFFSGETDLEHDRSLDPKTVTLCELPLDIIEMIVDKLDIPELCKMQRVSKPFRVFLEDTRVRKLLNWEEREHNEKGKRRKCICNGCCLWYIWELLEQILR